MIEPNYVGQTLDWQTRIASLFGLMTDPGVATPIPIEALTEAHRDTVIDTTSQAILKADGTRF
jgi:hypothetical protein